MSAVNLYILLATSGIPG